MRKHFQILVLFALSFHAIGLFIFPYFPALFSAETLHLMRYSGHGAILNVHHPAVFLFFLLPYFGLVGMIFFKNWARYLMLSFILLMLLLSFFFGVAISGPPETFVSGVSYLLDGAILGLAFLSPIKAAFEPVGRIK